MHDQSRPVPITSMKKHERNVKQLHG